MTETNDLLAPLNEKLEALKKRQEIISIEIRELGEEIIQLKNLHVALPGEEESIHATDISENYSEPEVQNLSGISVSTEPELRPIKRPDYSSSGPVRPPKVKSDLEKFIGENLINKIGIAVTVIGVAIGAKYSIDHDLISPLARIVLGYLIGLALMGVGFRLKKNYQNYSAVLVSGAIAILYFITFFAYSLYALMPQYVAFLFMVVFTAFAVYTSIHYNRQIIAHLGMVGAYAVPFLLGDSSGIVLILFSYIAIINIGILVVSFNKYWKPLYYVSFVITWLSYLSWYGEKFMKNGDFGLALTFLAVFFVIFYTVFLAYKLLKKELFDINDVFLLLANSFIFYGLGYSIFKTNNSAENLLGVFTLINAAIHFVVGTIIYSQKLADKNLYYMVVGLVLTFITIAIPVQLKGNWVTLLWAGEAALLFWIGRTKNIQFYEIICYVLIILTFVSIIQDWTTAYNCYIPGKQETRIVPIFNINFLTSVFVIASFGFINILNRDQKYPEAIRTRVELERIISILIPATLLVVLYYSFRIEIETYWNQLYEDSSKLVDNVNNSLMDRLQDSDLLKFRSIWIINYSLLMTSLLTFLNMRKLKSFDLGILSLILSSICLVVFLVQGLIDLSSLRDSYIHNILADHYPRTGYNIGIRYISYMFVGITLFSMYRYLTCDLSQKEGGGLKIGFDCLLHLTLLWIASSELITWMEIMKFSQSSKLGLTILWGVYALVLIVLGIWKKKKHLRVGAIALFGVTLYKLFFFDMEDLDTIAKTIVFLSLGVLLLIISFLYNKYKHLISD